MVKNKVWSIMIIKIFVVLLIAKLIGELWLYYLNRTEANRNAKVVPDSFADFIDGETYVRSVDYTLAKNKLSYFILPYEAIILAVIILSGLLPWCYNLAGNWLGTSVWADGLYLIAIGQIISLPDLPIEWWSQFRLEERFGFNKSTIKLWITDKLKGIAIGFIIGFPLICLLLKLVDWLGSSWWIWGFLIMFIFQLVMMILYPRLILPLFNKLTPLPEDDLRERLMTLADRTGFKAKTIQVIDGSKRSTHSNAYFTGFGRFRRIVLYDTLIAQMSPEQLEAVLAHEIGHYKKGHIIKMLALGAVMGLIGFKIIAYLAESSWFYEAFGFSTGSLAPAFLLVGLIGGVFTFWLTPLANILSRKYEYQADAFARNAIGSPIPMIESLRKLSEKNLSNLTPHPIFSGFYYSHPTLMERETALRAKSN